MDIIETTLTSSILDRLVGWFKPARTKSDKDLGNLGENLVCRYLKKLRLALLARNYMVSGGEVDIIALDGKTIVFIEVKTRIVDDVPAEASVDREKQRRITLAARQYLKRKDAESLPTRFDVIAVIDPSSSHPRLRHRRRAFEPVY